MRWDLTRLGIERDLEYECIITTIDGNGVKNAGAFAFTYLGDGRVLCNIFEGSKTLKNILDSDEYVVNITQNPLSFTYATLKCFDEDYFTQDPDIAIVRDAQAYIIVDVEDVKIKISENCPSDANRLYLITGKIRNVVVNDENARAFNRGMSGLIESLVNFSRYKIVGKNQRKVYMDRLVENQRVINRVSDEKTRKAMARLKCEYDRN